MEPRTYFVIGTNGIGKSRVLEKLQTLMPENMFAVYDFDQRGVPDNAGREWRRNETASWIKIGEINNQENKKTVIVGFAKPEEIEEASKQMENKPEIILLDGNTSTITERLKEQYNTEEKIKQLQRTTGKQLDKYIADSVYYAELLFELRFVHTYKIVNTNGRTPTEIAAEIMQFIFSGERGEGK